MKKKSSLALVFSSLGTPDGESFFIRLEAALHICWPRCLMNTEAGPSCRLINTELAQGAQAPSRARRLAPSAARWHGNAVLGARYSAAGASLEQSSAALSALMPLRVVT